MIQIDYREPQEIKDTLAKLLPTSVENMEAGDYAFIWYNMNSVGIARKEIKDFVSSLNSAWLDEDLNKCIRAFDYVFLVIEGVWDTLEGGELVVYKPSKDKKYFYRNMYAANMEVSRLYAAIESLHDQGIMVRFTCSMAGTARFIESLYKRKEEKHTLLHRYAKPRLPTLWTPDPYVRMLLSLPGIRLGEKQAKALLAKFNTPWGVLNASEKELKEVEGIGEGTVKQLYDCIGRYDLVTKPSPASVQAKPRSKRAKRTRIL